jgi:CHAT domain-containing protein
MRHHSAVVASLVAVFAFAVAAAPAPQKGRTPAVRPAGIVVEEVTGGSVLQKAGIVAGDVILSWRTPAASGELRTPFDFHEVTTNHLPHGNVVLTLRRGDEVMTRQLPAGYVRSPYRPILSAEVAAAYDAAKKLALDLKVDEAVAAYRAVLPRVEREAGATGAIWILARIAGVLIDGKRIEESVKVYDEAIARAMAENLPHVAARILEIKGTGLMRYNDFEGAEKAYGRALELRRGIAPDSLAVAFTLSEMAEVPLRKRDIRAAEALYAEALRIRERLAPGTRDHAEIVNALGRAAYLRGDMPAAEEHWKKSLVMIEAQTPGGFEHASALNSMGVVSQSRYELAAAEQYWLRAYEILARLLKDRPEVATLLNNLASVAKDRGDLANADEYLRRALDIRERVVPTSPDVADSLHNLGQLAALRHEYDVARETLTRALTVRQKIAPKSLDTARVLTSLGGLELSRRRYDEAEKYFQQAFELANNIAPESVETARAHSDLASIALARKDFATAVDLQRRAIAILEKLQPSGLDLAKSIQGVGDAALQQRNYEEAEKHFRRVLEIREKLAPASHTTAETLHRLGVVARDTNRLPDAAAHFRRAIETIESQATRVGGSEETRTSYLAGYVEYYRDYIDVLLRLKKTADAFHTVERSRARRLLTMLAERDLVLRDMPAELERERKVADREYDKMQQQVTAASAGNDAAKIDKAIADLRAARTRQQEIADRIRRESPHLATLRYPQPFTVEEASRTLDAGTLLLEYAVGEEATTLFVVQSSADARGKSPLSVHRIAAGEEQLRDAVERFRRLLERGARGVDNRKQIRSEAAALTRLLLPARRLAARAERLLISPDGPLHLLPFAALGGVQRSEAFLAEEKPLHVVISATVYAELQKRRAGDGGGRVTLAAFGDPRYPVAGDASVTDPVVRSFVKRYGLEPLPASREEVVKIAALFGDSAVQYLGADAREETAKEVASKARYLHFASHGVIDEAFPLNSGIVLTIPEEQISGDGDNGLLQAWEIFESVRMNANLVVLSACETALGREAGGEGLVGISRAFQYAGAQSVLASLWNVADESTSVLMEHFYRHVRAGASKDEALRRAQVALIHDTRFAHPYHWAAFNLLGDWR